MTTEVAVFIDYENLRYGLLNAHSQPVDLLHIVDKAKKYGRPSVMRAYADFAEHPAESQRQLQVAGIEAINVPVKRSSYDKDGRQIERIKNAADMVLALDAMVEALQSDKDGNVKTFLLVSGDADYVRVVTLLRNRFGQRVVIAGVPGCTAGDLVMAAGESDPIEVAAVQPADRGALKRAIVAMIQRGPAPLHYWSIKIIDQWSRDERQGFAGTDKEKREAIGDLLQEGVLIQSLAPDGLAKRAVLDEKRAQELGYL